MRYALGIEYEGTGFLGWQRLLPGQPTLQAELESALSFVAAAPVEVVCAGRTDSGVHAQHQVVHFDAPVEREPYAWMMGANSRLPRSIAVLWAHPVPVEFHARYSARARRYRYSILNRRMRPALEARFMAWERLPLDADAMHRAARVLLGTHDFNAFRSSQCQAPNPVREIQFVSITREQDKVVLEIQANAFLHHMIRNLVGTLLPIGRGERPVEWLGEVLSGCDRRVAGATAAASGLVFLGPRYPAHFNLPPEVTL